MRLHRLDLTGVGPFFAPQQIDFDDLSASGLFLIDGATGTGKTTIIDAIVYALFGDVSGGTDSDSKRIRSTYCTETDPTGVTLEFTVDGRRHRIHRVPAGARDPLTPGRTANANRSKQVLTEFDADGGEVAVLVKAGDIKQHVEALLAMNSDQFRQLVVLPQGRFADLLRMTPTERLTALASLLDHNEFFHRVQDDLKQRGLRAEDERRTARGLVSAAAQQLTGRLRGYLDALDPAPTVDFADSAPTDDERLAAATSIMTDLALRADAARAQREAQAIVADEARVAAARARGVADALAAVGEAQSAVAGARSGLDEADAGIEPGDIDSRIGALRVQEGALGEHARWEAQADARADARRRLAHDEAVSRAGAEALRTQKAALPDRRAALDRTRAAALKLAGTLSTASDDVDRLAVLVDKGDEVTALAPDLARLAQVVADAEAAETRAAQSAERAHTDWLLLVDQQRSDQAARLASTLADTDPCPVCGSTVHPHLAQPSAGHDLIADTEVTAAKRRHDEAAAAARAAARAVAEARVAWQQADTRMSILLGALGTATPDSIRAEYDAAVGRRRAAQEAEGSLAAIDDELADLAASESTLDAEISVLETQANQIAGVIAERDAAEVLTGGAVRAAIGVAESATALLAATRTRIDGLVALNRARGRLDSAAAAVPPDQRSVSAPVAAQAAALAEAASLEADASLESLAATEATIAATVADSTPLLAAFAAALAERRSVDERTAATVALAALATGANSRKLPLRSYALQRRFESVLAAASVHLVRMSAGKFAFELSEQVGAGHAGLGIALHDSWTGHTQEPKSLSGGETFYAALSLALGLADVVRGEAGGSALETLFIDEGFGSLDQETLYQVLDQLDLMRSGGRVVGVISHVTEMKESIPDRIEVRRGADSRSVVLRPEGE